MSYERRIEWAVIRDVFRCFDVVKDGLGSREEADAWLAALTITQARTNREHFMRTDGLILSEPLRVVWRYVEPWRVPDE